MRKCVCANMYVWFNVCPHSAGSGVTGKREADSDGATQDNAPACKRAKVEEGEGYNCGL